MYEQDERYFCPHCAHPVNWVLPVEPVYDLKVAAWLIPTTYQNLRQHLKRFKEEYPNLYRTDVRGGNHRLLRAGDIRKLRRFFIKYKDPDGNYINLSDYGRDRHAGKDSD